MLPTASAAVIRDQFRRDLYPIDLTQRSLDLARGHSPRTERNDLVIEVFKSTIIDTRPSAGSVRTDAEPTTSQEENAVRRSHEIR